jgi:hypothetical protein
MDEAPCKQEREKKCAYWGLLAVDQKCTERNVLTFMGA